MSSSASLPSKQQFKVFKGKKKFISKVLFLSPQEKLINDKKFSLHLSKQEEIIVNYKHNFRKELETVWKSNHLPSILECTKKILLNLFADKTLLPVNRKICFDYFMSLMKLYFSENIVKCIIINAEEILFNDESCEYLQNIQSRCNLIFDVYQNHPATLKQKIKQFLESVFNQEALYAFDTEFKYSCNSMHRANLEYLWKHYKDLMLNLPDYFSHLLSNSNCYKTKMDNFHKNLQDFYNNPIVFMNKSVIPSLVSLLKQGNGLKEEWVKVSFHLQNECENTIAQALLIENQINEVKAELEISLKQLSIINAKKILISKMEASPFHSLCSMSNATKIGNGAHGNTLSQSTSNFFQPLSAPNVATGQESVFSDMKMPQTASK